MRVSDWLGFATLGVVIGTLVAVARGNWQWASACFLVTVTLALATRYWSVKYPAPMPYGLRWSLLVPRGGHSPEKLERILQPRGGEHLLEIGPGVGVHALAVASSLAPDGTLDILDVQPEMLEHSMRRARAAGVTGLVPMRADARRLPYPDETFDGAFVVGVLGEIPEHRRALRELRRVLKPSGRLVIGEVFFDPDFVPFSTLRKEAEEASFSFDERLGGSLTYFARFRPSG